MRQYKVTIQPKRLNWRKNSMYDKDYYFDSARGQWFVDGKPWDSPLGHGYPARISVSALKGVDPKTPLCPDCETPLEAYRWCPSCYLHQSLDGDGPLSLAENILNDPDATHSCLGRNRNVGANALRPLPPYEAMP